MLTLMMRRFAAVALAVSLSLAVPALAAPTLAVPALAVPTGAALTLADSQRWAPSPDLEDGDQFAARAVFGLPRGMAWIPWEGHLVAPAVAESLQPAAKSEPVTLKAPSAVLMEARSGRLLYEKNGHERRNPASVTKIMTLIVAFDALRDHKVKLVDQVTVSDEAAKQIGTIIFADRGETFSLADLLLSVAVGSANDAAVSVAEHVSGSVETFVAAMNAKAKGLGMNDTQFQNPTGLSAEGHFTSAFDIALMSRYAALNYPEMVKLTAIYGTDLQVPWRQNGPTFRLWNNNKLLTWYRGADGLKTGWTEAAGYCLAATAVRDNVRMIAVVMGAETPLLRNADAAKLLDYGFSNYTAVTIAAKGDKIGQIRVARGRAPVVDLLPQELFAVSVTKGEQSKVKVQAEIGNQIEAPVAAGQVVGQLVATLDGKELARMPVIAAIEVPKANLWQTVLYHLGQVFTLR